MCKYSSCFSFRNVKTSLLHAWAWSKVSFSPYYGMEFIIFWDNSSKIITPLPWYKGSTKYSTTSTPPQIGTPVTLTCRYYPLGKTAIWLQRWDGGRRKVILSSVCICLHCSVQCHGIQVLQPLFQQCVLWLQLVEIMGWSWWNLQLLLLIGSQTSISCSQILSNIKTCHPCIIRKYIEIITIPPQF